MTVAGLHEVPPWRPGAQRLEVMLDPADPSDGAANFPCNGPLQRIPAFGFANDDNEA
jgi:hypothetical protein